MLIVASVISSANSLSDKRWGEHVANGAEEFRRIMETKKPPPMPPPDAAQRALNLVTEAVEKGHQIVQKAGFTSEIKCDFESTSLLLSPLGVREQHVIRFQINRPASAINVWNEVADRPPVATAGFPSVNEDWVFEKLSGWVQRVLPDLKS